jgi:hypothetical protein
VCITIGSDKKLHFYWYQVKMGFSAFPKSDVESCVSYSKQLETDLEPKIIKCLFPKRGTWNSECHLVISRSLSNEHKATLGKNYTLHEGGGNAIPWPHRIKEFANKNGLKLP